MSAWYRWFAVFGVVTLAALGFAYKGQIPKLSFSSASGGTTVPLLGASASNESALAADTSAFGRLPIVRVYYPGLPASNAWTGGMAGANHSAVIVSFKAQPSAILSGADDAALKHFFDTAPTGHPIYYSYYHEPEDNIAAGQFSLAGYKAAWARVVRLADEAHNPYLHSTLILMGWDLVRASHRYWKNYLPAGHIISTLGWDTYPAGSAENIHPVLEPATGFMAPAIKASKSVGLPYGFPEFGLSTSKGRAGWLRSVGSYIMHSGALFASYFNGCAQYPTLRLTDRASQAVWRGFVTASRNGVPTPQPKPSPKPSPSRSPAPVPAPPAGPGVSHLLLAPRTVSARSQESATLSFKLSKGADVSVLVVNASGRVMRTVARPYDRAGANRIAYLTFRHGGHGLIPGRYTVLVVAANAHGSSSRAAALTIR